MCRMNLYPANYWNGSAPVPSGGDGTVLEAHTKGVIPMILFEDYASYNDIGDYNKWFAIGQAFANRYHPNSAWLQSQGITNWGITIYTAINEPDNDNAIPKTGTNSYYSALEGLADGVHSVDATLKVNPGGFMSENAYSDHTLRGYGTAIAPLWNNGKLDGIDLHTYNDISFAPITGSFSHSPQSDFDSVKSTCGITRDINFYATEFNFKKDASQGIDENLAAKRLLTCIWANLGVVKNDGHAAASQFAFVWNIFSTTTSDTLYGICTQLSPWTPTARGTTLQLVLSKTKGMQFTSLDPKGRGEFILTGSGGSKMWVLQNLQFWSSIYGTSYTVSGIPAGAKKLEVYGWDGLRQTITLSGQTSYTVTGLNNSETYMFLCPSFFTVYEAENLTVATYNCPTAPRLITGDPNFSNSAASILDSTAANQYVTYLVPNVAAAPYNIKVGVKKLNTRGIWQLHIGRADNFSGTQSSVGSPQDEYSASALYTELDLGTWTPGTTSDKWFQFLITGKNAASTNYGECIDYIKLTPQ